MEKMILLWCTSQTNKVQLPRGNLSPRCAYVLHQGDHAPKTINEVIKLNVNKVISPLMKKLNSFLASERKLEKATPKRLPIKNSTGSKGFFF